MGKNNIILLGPTHVGKTTVAGLLAKKLGKKQVTCILEEYEDAVIDFGAGQSVYEDPKQAEAFLKRMEKEPDVFLLLPYRKTEKSLAVLDQRTGKEEQELNRLFVGAKTSRQAAKHIIYIEERTAEEIADEIAGIIEFRKKINEEEFEISSDRLRIRSIQKKYIPVYYRELDEEITKYQYPDPFENVETAEKVLGDFMQGQKEGRDIFCVMLDQKGNFVGSVEAHGIDTSSPEVGIWIAREQQGKGYGEEGIRRIMEFVRKNRSVRYFIYEADYRNQASVRLVEKLGGEKTEQNEITTVSGKHLVLDMYLVR